MKKKIADYFRQTEADASRVAQLLGMDTDWKESIAIHQEVAVEAMPFELAEYARQKLGMPEARCAPRSFSAWLDRLYDDTSED